jgi:two-component system, LytTR family, response regulator LytT
MESNTTNKLRVLIIEDEPFAQQELKRLLTNIPRDIEVLQCIDSVEDSIEWLNESKHPDLIFMDIQLSDGLSFEIFKAVKIKVPVIFTTAFDEYAIKAFKVNSLDYLLKPIEPEELNAAFVKFDDIKMHYSLDVPGFNLEQLDKMLTMLKPKSDYKSRFIAKVGDQIKHIKTDDIAYFFADDNIVFMVTESNAKYIIDYSLNQIEAFLDPKFFFRLNRTYFANIKSIAKVHKFFNSRLKIELKPSVEEDILVSRVKVSDFLNWLES